MAKQNSDKTDLIKSLLESITIPRHTYHSTGSLVMDNLLGGGIPSNATVCFIGEPQSGKTSFCYIIMAETIRNGRKPMLVTTEGKFDLAYLLRACNLPENMSDEEIASYMWIFSGNEQQTQFDRMLKIVTNGLCDMVVLDSISAFVPDNFIDMPDSPQYAAATKANNHFMRVMPNACLRMNIPMIITAQYRTDVFAMSNIPNAKVERKSIAGGTRPIMYGTSIVLDLSATTCDLDGNEIKGVRQAFSLTATVKKAQYSRIRVGDSASTVVVVATDAPIVDVARECIEMGDLHGIFTGKDGNQLKGNVNANSIRFFGSIQLGNKRDAIKKLRDDTVLCDEIYEKVRKAIIDGNSITVIGTPQPTTYAPKNEGNVEL